MKSLLPSHSDTSADPSTRSENSTPILACSEHPEATCFTYRFERMEDEEELLRRCSRTGAEGSDAVVKILERLEPAAFSICNLMIEDRAEAAACEDACVEAVSGLFKGVTWNASGFRVTFFQIVRRHCQRYSAMTEPGNNAAHRDYRALIAGMTDVQRWAVVLRFVASLSQAEVGSVLGLPSPDVKSHLWDAVRQLMGAGFANDV
jgi:hypothetical protein